MEEKSRIEKNLELRITLLKIAKQLKKLYDAETEEENEEWNEIAEQTMKSYYELQGIVKSWYER